MWICADGDVIFEGKVAHQYDAYLIGANINTIKPYFETIKGIIVDYCRKNEGHHIYDPSRNNRDIEYYGRREDGFIEKRISNIESFKYEDLIKLFNDAIENKEFPNGQALIELKKSISAYLEYMDKYR